MFIGLSLNLVKTARNIFLGRNQLSEVSVNQHVYPNFWAIFHSQRFLLKCFVTLN